MYTVYGPAPIVANVSNVLVVAARLISGTVLGLVSGPIATTGVTLDATQGIIVTEANISGDNASFSTVPCEKIISYEGMGLAGTPVA